MRGRLTNAVYGVSDAAAAGSAAGILPAIVIGSPLMGLTITGTYAMQALGLFRTVACIHLCGRAAMLLLMNFLLHMRIRQVAIARVCSRVCYGSAALLVYRPLFRRLVLGTGAAEAGSSLAIPCKLQEGGGL
jgi:hypothetical protein